MIRRLVFIAFLLHTFSVIYSERSGLFLLFDGIECVRKLSPWGCAQETLKRSIDNWDKNLMLEKNEFIEELNEEVTNLTVGESRNFGENNKESPTELIMSVLKDVNSISETIAETIPRPNDKSVSRNLEDETDEEFVDVDVEDRAGSGKKGKKKKGVYYVHYDDHEEEPEYYYRGKGKKGGYGGKKGKKKGYMRIFMVGAALKAKLEMLLKLLSFHLQLKFFAIAAIGLIVNVARFWLDIKKGHTPQKVIYYEHAQHQHHYDEHGDDWNGGGGYWKRTNEPYSYNGYETDMKV